MEASKRALLLEFFKKALEFIKANQPSSPAPYIRIIRPTFTEQCFYGFEVRDGLDGPLACYSFIKTFQSWPAALEAAQMLIDDGLVPPIDFECCDVPPPEAFPEECILRDLVAVLADYITRYNTFDYNEEQLSTILDKYLLSWSHDEITVEIIAPMHNFDADFDELDLPGCLKITRFLPAEKERLWPHSTGLTDIDIEKFASCKYKISGTYKRKRGETKIVSELGEAILSTILALRLTQPGHVSILGAFSVKLPPVIDIDGFGFQPLSANTFNTSCVFNTYRLGPDSRDKFKVILQNLLDSLSEQNVTPLRTAFRWFNQSYLCAEIQDKIINLAISLECTLLHGEYSELSYKMASRGAALLKDRFKPSDTHSTLKTLYNARSKFVHEGLTMHSLPGAKTGFFGGISLNDLPMTMENLVREILVEYLARISPSKKISAINEDLDALLITKLSSP